MPIPGQFSTPIDTEGLFHRIPLGHAAGNVDGFDPITAIFSIGMKHSGIFLFADLDFVRPFFRQRLHLAREVFR